MSNTFEFEFELGGVVVIDCSVGVRFGTVVRDSLKVEFCGETFDVEGLVIDYEGEFLPLSDYLYGFAKQEIREAKKGNPSGVKLELY